MKNQGRILSLLTLAFAASNALALDVRDEVPNRESAEFQHQTQFVLSFGIQSGGDKMVQLINVSDGSTDDLMRAGGYYLGQLGINLAVGESPFSVQITGGELYTESESNINSAHGSFKRHVVEFIPFWNFSRYRIGVGAVEHLNPKFRFVEATGETFSATADDATGLVVETDARYDKNIAVGLRYTFIKYDFGGGVEFSGNALGLSVTATF